MFPCLFVFVRRRCTFAGLLDGFEEREDWAMVHGMVSDVQAFRAGVQASGN
jgi:hypothetical protein